jgi:hypothetical protein
MAAGSTRAEQLTPEQMVARLAPSIERAAAERATAKQDRRAQFPLMAEMTDLFRDAGMAPRPVHAINAAGEEWGRAPDLGLSVDGDKLARLPEYEAFWRRFYGKQKDSPAAYHQRMQRAIRPTRGTE